MQDMIERQNSELAELREKLDSGDHGALKAQVDSLTTAASEQLERALRAEEALTKAKVDLEQAQADLRNLEVSTKADVEALKIKIEEAKTAGVLAVEAVEKKLAASDAKVIELEKEVAELKAE